MTAMAKETDSAAPEGSPRPDLREVPTLRGYWIDARGNPYTTHRYPDPRRMTLNYRYVDGVLHVGFLAQAGSGSERTVSWVRLDRAILLAWKDLAGVPGPFPDLAAAEALRRALLLGKDEHTDVLHSDGDPCNVELGNLAWASKRLALSKVRERYRRKGTSLSPELRRLVEGRLRANEDYGSIARALRVSTSEVSKTATAIGLGHDQLRRARDGRALPWAERSEEVKAIVARLERARRGGLVEALTAAQRIEVEDVDPDGVDGRNYARVRIYFNGEPKSYLQKFSGEGSTLALQMAVREVFGLDAAHEVEVEAIALHPKPTKAPPESASLRPNGRVMTDREWAGWLAEKERKEIRRVDRDARRIADQHFRPKADPAIGRAYEDLLARRDAARAKAEAPVVVSEPTLDEFVARAKGLVTLSLASDRAPDGAPTYTAKVTRTEGGEVKRTFLMSGTVRQLLRQLAFLEVD